MVMTGKRRTAELTTLADSPTVTTPQTSHTFASIAMGPIAVPDSCDSRISLPIELKQEILRFCDPASLAVSSRASLAFLELAAPLLYYDVVIRSSQALGKLFCSREVSGNTNGPAHPSGGSDLDLPSSRQLAVRRPEIERLLSLGQIKHLTVRQARNWDTGSLSADRISPESALGRRIGLDCLAIETYIADNLPRVLDLVNPIRFSVSSLSTTGVSLARRSISDAQWTRLRTLHLRNAYLALPELVGTVASVDVEFDCSTDEYLTEVHKMLLILPGPPTIGQGRVDAPPCLGGFTVVVGHERARGEVTKEIEMIKEDLGRGGGEYFKGLDRLCDIAVVAVRKEPSECCLFPSDVLPGSL